MRNRQGGIDRRVRDGSAEGKAVGGWGKWEENSGASPPFAPPTGLHTPSSSCLPHLTPYSPPPSNLILFLSSHFPAFRDFDETKLAHFLPPGSVWAAQISTTCISLSYLSLGLDWMITCSKGLFWSLKARPRVWSNFPQVVHLVLAHAHRGIIAHRWRKRDREGIDALDVDGRLVIFAGLCLPVALATTSAGGIRRVTWPSTGAGRKVRMKNVSSWKAMSSMAAKFSSTSSRPLLSSPHSRSLRISSSSLALRVLARSMAFMANLRKPFSGRRRSRG